MIKIKVIIVDDETLLLNELKMLIETETISFEIIGIYESGEALLENLVLERADLYILDVHLPDMAGYELCDKIFDTTGALPNVVYISGEPTPTITKNIFDSKCIIIDFLLRGFEIERLKQTEQRAITVIQQKTVKND